MGSKSLRYGSIVVAVAVGIWAAVTAVGSAGPGGDPVVSPPAAVEEPAVTYLDHHPVIGERIEPPPLRVVEAPLPAAASREAPRARTSGSGLRSADGTGRRRAPSA